MVRKSWKLGVVIVHYGSNNDTYELLNSLCDQSYNNWHAFIVDNDPLHRLDENKIKKIVKYPYTLILSAKNIGWPAGANMGARAAVKDSCRVISFLTSDLIVVDKKYLEKLTSPIKSGLTKITLPVVVYNQERDKVWMAGGQLNKTLMYTKALHANQSLNTISDTDRIDFGGIGLTVDSELLNSVKYWNTDYFLYYEDLDLCTKLIKKGTPIKLIRDTSIAHKTSTASSKINKSIEPISAFCYSRGGFIYVKKHINFPESIASVVGLWLVRSPIFLGSMLLIHKNYKAFWSYLYGLSEGMKILLDIKSIRKANAEIDKYR